MRAQELSAGTAVWDVVIVGSGPAGAAAALGALHARPGASVLLLDRNDFPRDKCCGDAVLGRGLRELEAHGVPATTLAAGYRATRLLRVSNTGGTTMVGRLPDDMIIVPRLVFDARLLTAARAAGATWRRHAVRQVRSEADLVELDGAIRARVVIGADGAESVVRRAVGGSARRQVAVALRGYDPTGPSRFPKMVFDHRDGLSYAWCFPPSNGPANIGYGHLLRSGQSANRAALLDATRRLLPGARPDPATLRAHRLPLSTTRQPVAQGRVLLAGDAAALINPLSGEGIYYAIASGLAAGAAATNPETAADDYRRTLRRRLGVHLQHTSALAALTASKDVLEAGIRAAAANPRVFDDLARVGLADGRITGRLALALVSQLVPLSFRTLIDTALGWRPSGR